MIEITVRMIPKGRQEDAYTMRRMYIDNDKTGTKTMGNYRVREYRGNSATINKETQVLGFKRKRHNVWMLIFAALFNLYDKGGVTER